MKRGGGGVTLSLGHSNTPRSSVIQYCTKVFRATTELSSHYLRLHVPGDVSSDLLLPSRRYEDVTFCREKILLCCLSSREAYNGTISLKGVGGGGGGGGGGGECLGQQHHYETPCIHIVLSLHKHLPRGPYLTSWYSSSSFGSMPCSMFTMLPSFSITPTSFAPSRWR